MSRETKELQFLQDGRAEAIIALALLLYTAGLLNSERSEMMLLSLAGAFGFSLYGKVKKEEYFGR